MIETVKFIENRVVLEILQKSLKMNIFLPTCKHFEVTVSSNENHWCSASACMCDRGELINDRNTVRKASFFADRIVGNCLTAYRICFGDTVCIKAILSSEFLGKNKHE